MVTRIVAQRRWPGTDFVLAALCVVAPPSRTAEGPWSSGTASAEDVDKAVWPGPGLRWAAMGPHMPFHLGAGPGGMGEFCNRYRDSFHRWCEDLGTLELIPELAALLAGGVADEAQGRDVTSASAERDALIVVAMQATRDQIAPSGCIGKHQTRHTESIS